jgi:hypothetical protein
MLFWLTIVIESTSRTEQDYQRQSAEESVQQQEQQEQQRLEQQGEQQDQGLDKGWMDYDFDEWPSIDGYS